MRRGYVRHSGRVSGKKQIASMVGHLVEPYYVQGEDEDVMDAIRSIRPGDELCVTTLDRLAPKRTQLGELIEEVHKRGGVIFELDTGRRSDDVRALPAMISEAFEALLRDHRHQQRRTGRKVGKKGGRPVRSDRMPEAEALAIWRNLELNDWQALQQMTGWTLRTAYRRLKARGFPAGWPAGKPRKTS
jgi:DNA invertase Pin-like site-specific DNA recombinase